MVLAPLYAGFQSLPLLPTIKLGPSGADFRVDGFVYVLGPLGLSNELSCEAGSFSCCHLNPHRCFQSVVWGFISPRWSPGLGLLPCLPAAALLCVLSAQLPISAPPTGLDECFFFISLVVGLPYSLVFSQFWLYFVFKLLSFFWLCKEAQCVYLCLHLGWKSEFYS